MGSQRGGRSRTGGAPAQNHLQIEDKKANSLARQGTLYNLTLDEVQNQLGDLGKPLSSMNLDELLKTVWTAEANSQAVEGVDCCPASQQLDKLALGSSVNRQSNLTLSRDLSKKTVDEVWEEIQQVHKRSCLDRKFTLGDMTLEDFLVKAGVVAESSPEKSNSGSVIGAANSIGMSQQAQWVNYTIPLVHPQQQQQQNILPVYMPGHPVQQPIPFGQDLVTDAAYPENQMTMSSSPLIGTLSDTQAPTRKRVTPDDVVEKSVERRQKRMIKNRESAARSRARRQAYTHELENKVSRLEEENERLKRQREWEKVLLPSIPLPEPRYQLRRTSSASI